MYVEISARQTGKTARLIGEANKMAEISRNDVAILVPNIHMRFIILHCMDLHDNISIYSQDATDYSSLVLKYVFVDEFLMIEDIPAIPSWYYVGTPNPDVNSNHEKIIAMNGGYYKYTLA